MPTFKIDKKVYTNQPVEKGNLSLVDKQGKNAFYEKIDKKIVIDKHNLLFHHGKGWTIITVNNVQEKESWSGWSSVLQDVEELKVSLKGWTDKNKRFIITSYDNDNRILVVHGDTVVDVPDDKLTMVVYQRNSPGTSRFDCTWCFHSKHLCLTSTHVKKEFDHVHSVICDMTDNVFDNGPELYNWNVFLKTQKNQNGDENDWIGVFAPFTDEEDEEDDDDDDEDYEEESEEEEEDDDEEEEEEEFVGSETEEDEDNSWDDESDESDDDEYRPSKKSRLC